jgi:hypothetical protein
MMRAGWLAALWLLTSGFTLGGTVGTRALTVTFNAPLTSTLTVASSAGDGTPTFLRNSIRTCTNASGQMETLAANIPCFDHEVTAPYADRGLYVEGSRTNSLLFSVGFTASQWVKLRTASLSAAGPAIVGPDGTSATYYGMQDDGSSAIAPAIYQDYTSTSAKAQAASVYAKAGGATWLMIEVDDRGAGQVRRWFNLGTGVKGSGSVAGSASHWWESSSSIEAAPNGWYRCVVVTGTPSGTAKRVALFLCDRDNSITYAPVSASLFLFGAQVEDNAAFASSYIPTTTAAVTRAADVLTYASAGNVPTTGPGTVAATIDTYASAVNVGGQIAVDTRGGSGADGIVLYGASNTSRPSWFIRSGGATQVDVSYAVALGNNTPTRMVGTWSVNDFALYTQGVSRATDTSGSNPTSHTRLAIGCDNVNVSQTFGHVRNVLIFNAALTAQEVGSYVGLYTP